ncbi:MAG: SocA family protein [Synergistaceae bacterium]|nr:SocA family protein [Synergistaceae bacterium]
MKNIAEEEFDVTPMKLQKLLYYCQGYSLALTGKPMFNEEIEAWSYGPVVPSVYQEYKACGRCCIPFESVGDEHDVDSVDASIAQLVVREKGCMSGIALAKMTHREAPWLNAYEGKYTNCTISRESIKAFFDDVLQQTELYEEDEDNLWLSVGEPMSCEDWEELLAKV